MQRSRRSRCGNHPKRALLNRRSLFADHGVAILDAYLIRELQDREDMDFGHGLTHTPLKCFFEAFWVHILIENQLSRRPRPLDRDFQTDAQVRQAGGKRNDESRT